MNRRSPSAALCRSACGLALVLLGLVACGRGGQAPAATPSADPSGPVTQSTALPDGWPEGLTIPDGATVTYTTADDTGMSVLFSCPQDLATIRVWFDELATGLGYHRKTDESFVGMLSTSWSNGDRTISVTATPVGDHTSGLLLVRPEG